MVNLYECLGITWFWNGEKLVERLVGHIIIQMNTCLLDIDQRDNDVEHESRERARDNMATASGGSFAALDYLLPVALIGRRPDSQVASNHSKNDVVELLFF